MGPGITNRKWGWDWDFGKNQKIGWEVGFMQISIFDISIAIFLSKVLPAGIMGLILVNKASPSSTLVSSVLVSDLTFGINVA